MVDGECIQSTNFSTLLSRRNKIHALDVSPTRLKSRREMLRELFNDANFGIVVNAYSKHYCPELDLKNEYFTESGILTKVFGLGKMSEYEKIVTTNYRKSIPNVQRLPNDISGNFGSARCGVASSTHSNNNSGNEINYSSEQALLLE